MKRTIVALLALAATPVFADVNGDRLAEKLGRHLTQHGAKVVAREAKLLNVGDVSPSGLKDELRDACPRAQSCLDAAHVGAQDAQVGMYYLVLNKAEHELERGINALKRRKTTPQGAGDISGLNQGDRDKLRIVTQKWQRTQQLQSQMIQQQQQALQNIIGRM